MRFQDPENDTSSSSVFLMVSGERERRRGVIEPIIRGARLSPTQHTLALAAVHGYIFNCSI